MGSNKRKIIYYFIGLLCLLLIPSINVNANTIDGGWQNAALIQSISSSTGELLYQDLGYRTYDNYGSLYLDYPVWWAPVNFLSQPTKIIITTTALQNKCIDSVSMTIKGQMYLTGSGNTMAVARVMAYNSYTNKNLQCIHSVNQSGNYYIDFECTGNFNQGDTNIEVYYGDYSFSSSSPDRYLNVRKGLDYTCNTDGSAEIISNANSNTDKLIDSQNKIDQSIKDTNESINRVDSTLNNSDSSGATDSAGNFFSGFTTDTFGLTSIITAPINLIKSITSSTCSPMGVPVPFVDTTMNLPCLSSIYRSYFGSFLDIYQTITFGIVGYWVCVKIFALVKDFKNPEHDEIEVLDL